MNNKVKFHTVQQPDSDITCFILSCNRLDVLDKTITSFNETKQYTVKYVIVDDSAEEGIFETLVSRYGDYSDVICFPRNRSQWWAMDFMVSYCDTEYIFYLEDDWELLRPGYLQMSKQILEKYREIGVVDISWRTFEWQGIDSYDKKLIDGMFFWKKPWKITDYHLAWHMWVGSPNLKRRDDLVMLGRVEKWHSEWNIDREFTALGFKGVFLDGEYARHLGDECSRMEGKRPNDTTVPYDFYPKEVLHNRTAPMMDYYEMDRVYPYPGDITLVTGLMDLTRGDRTFEEHYLKGLDSLLAMRNPLVVYADEKHHQYIIDRRKQLNVGTSDNQIVVWPLDQSRLMLNVPGYSVVDQLIQDPQWIGQAEWIADSALTTKDYVALTLLKFYMLHAAAQQNPFGISKRFYWVDSGMVNSFAISEPLTNFDFLKLPNDDRMLMSSFPYTPDAEVHGYSVAKMLQLYWFVPQYVCRATIFGGSPTAIQAFAEPYKKVIENSLANGCIGTEEAIFTIVEQQYPDLVHRIPMVNGDIHNLLTLIRK